jgi:hypothetical protein
MMGLKGQSKEKAKKKKKKKRKDKIKRSVEWFRDAGYRRLWN